MKLRELKENPNMNPIVKYILIALASVGVVGATVFGIYKSNEIKEAATQQEVVVDKDTLLNDKSGQETIDVDALAETYYNENKDNIKSGTTLEDWTTVFKDYWASTNADESATVRNCLNYFALDTLTAEDVENGKTVELTPEEQAVINLEMNGEEDDAEVKTTSVEQETATTEASIEISTDTVNAKDYEVEYYDNTKTMYAIRSVNIRKGPNADDFEKVGSLNAGAGITVKGVVEEYDAKDTFWLCVEYNGEEAFISGAYLSDTKINTTSSSGNTSSGNTSSSSRSTQTSSTSSDLNSHANESSNYGKPKGVSGPPADIPVQSGGSGDGVAVGDQGINWH